MSDNVVPSRSSSGGHGGVILLAALAVIVAGGMTFALGVSIGKGQSSAGPPLPVATVTVTAPVAPASPGGTSRGVSDHDHDQMKRVVAVYSDTGASAKQARATSGELRAMAWDDAAIGAGVTLLADSLDMRAEGIESGDARVVGEADDLMGDALGVLSDAGISWLDYLTVS